MVTLAATVVHLKHRHVRALLVHTGLEHRHTRYVQLSITLCFLRLSSCLQVCRGATHFSGATGGTLGHRGRVRDVVSQVEEGPSADQAGVVEGGGEDLGITAQQGALLSSPTLDPPAVNIPVGQQTEA